MDHKAFLSTLSDADRTALCRLQDGPALVHLAIQFGLICLFAGAIVLSAPAWPLLLAPLGVLLAFLFNLQHECTHKTPFRTTWINEWIGWVCGLILFQPFLWFRYFHLAHHRYTNDPRKDPELIEAPKPENWRDFTVFVSSVFYWRDKVKLLFTNAFGTIESDYLPRSAYGRVRREARMMLFIYAVAATFSLIVSPILIYIWIFPLMIGFPVLRLYHLAEHGRCPYAANMFQNTRTVFTCAPVRMIAWNMPYHVEHHILPTVPFHRLPQLHELTQQSLEQTADGYLKFTKDYASHVLNQAPDL